MGVFMMRSVGLLPFPRLGPQGEPIGLIWYVNQSTFLPVHSRMYHVILKKMGSCYKYFCTFFTQYIYLFM